MINTTKLNAYNDLQGVSEYSTRIIDEIFESSGVTEEELSILEDGVQNVDMIIKGVVSQIYLERSLEKLKKTCDKEVFELFLKSIEEKDIKVVTEYSIRKKRKIFNIWNIFKNK